MNKIDILNTFNEEAFNKGNLSVIDNLVHPDYRYNSPTDQLNGRSELTGFISALRQAFPDISVEPIDQIEDAEKVCTRLVIKGTHLGPFLDIPPTGNPIHLQGVVISRFKDGLIHEEWELLDQYTFLSQLGVIQNFS